MRMLEVSSRSRVLRASVSCLLLAACAGPVPVSAEKLAAEEERLLRPFVAPQIVIAEEVELTVSPNFFNRVGQPALDPILHTRTVVRTPAAEEYRFVNQRGGVERPLRLLIGETQYHALKTATLSVLPSGAAMTLQVVARGDVSVLAGGKRRDVPAIEIRDGAWRDR